MTSFLDKDGLTYYNGKINTKLGNKVDKVSGKGLSTNDYTTAEKNKLSGIASGAEVNVQSNWSQTDSTKDDYIKNKPTIPTVNNGTLTIQKNGTNVATFTANQSGNSTANITIPEEVVISTSQPSSAELWINPNEEPLIDPTDFDALLQEVVISNVQPEADNHHKLWLLPRDGSVEEGLIATSLDGDENDKAPSVKVVNDKIRPHVLYNNTTGSNGNITLSDNASNYAFLEIYYIGSNNRRGSLKILGTDTLISITNFAYTNHLWWANASYSISGKNLTLSTYCDGWLDSSSSALEKPSNFIKITKVVGYK